MIKHPPSADGTLFTKEGRENDMLPYNRKLKPRSQELRRKSTPQENKLWYEFLRKHDCRFARQKPIDQYIVDFICQSKNLVIEIDGSQHYTENGLAYDGTRTAILEGLGLHVMRFTNIDIDANFDKVCEAIQDFIDL